LKKAIRKREICEKTAQKRSKFQLKQAQKQPTRKSSKNPQLHKKQAQIRGKTARLAALEDWAVLTRQRNNETVVLLRSNSIVHAIR